MDSKPADRPRDTVAPVTRGPGSVGPQPHRADAVGAGDVGNVLTKFAVVLLSSINAVLWEVYTEAPVMAAVWAAIAVWFVIWLIREVRNR